MPPRKKIHSFCCFSFFEIQTQEAPTMHPGPGGIAIDCADSEQAHTKCSYQKRIRNKGTREVKTVHSFRKMFQEMLKT